MSEGSAETSAPDGTGEEPNATPVDALERVSTLKAALRSHKQDCTRAELHRNGEVVNSEPIRISAKVRPKWFPWRSTTKSRSRVPKQQFIDAQNQFLAQFKKHAETDKWIRIHQMHYDWYLLSVLQYHCMCVHLTSLMLPCTGICFQLRMVANLSGESPGKTWKSFGVMHNGYPSMCRGYLSACTSAQVAHGCILCIFQTVIESVCNTSLSRGGGTSIVDSQWIYPQRDGLDGMYDWPRYLLSVVVGNEESRIVFDQCPVVRSSVAFGCSTRGSLWKVCKTSLV